MLTGGTISILAVKEEAMHLYPPEVCQHMKAFCDSLSEKDRRRYAAVEAELRNANGESAGTLNGVYRDKQPTKEDGGAVIVSFVGIEDLGCAFRLTGH